MALTDLLKSFARAVTFGAALYSCGGEEKEGCSTDYDCREPRVCVRGYCESADGQNNRLSDESGADGACAAICSRYSCAEDFDYGDEDWEKQCNQNCTYGLRDCSSEFLQAVENCFDEDPTCNDPWIKCLKRYNLNYSCLD